MKKKVSNNLLKRIGTVSTAAMSTATMLITAASGCATSAPSVTSDPPVNSLPLENRGSAIQKNPNVVYIVIDDMGYSDLGSYGSSISTPNIDALANQGILYNNYYTQPMSSPSRASMLTGCESNLVGMGIISDIDFGANVPNIHGRIYDEHGTMADSLSQKGYETFAVGKWHLGPFPSFTSTSNNEHWPSDLGFTENYCFVGAQANQLEPGAMMVGDEFAEVDFSANDYHFTTDMVDTSIEFIEGAGDKTFFLYFATGAMHGPLQVDPEYSDRYIGVFSEGYDVEREKILARQIEIGLFPEGTTLPPRNPGVLAWDDLTADDKKVAERHMEVYAGFLEHTDEEIGRLVADLKAKDEYDNTIFVLVSDNGSNAVGGDYGYSSAHRNSNIMQENTTQQLEVLDQFGGIEYGTQYNSGWAMSSATPFRYNKASAFNGGLRVPLIVSYTDGIDNPGRINDELLDSSDITPTILSVLGIKPPAVIDGVEQHKMEGLNFKETFKSNDPLVGHDKTLTYILGNTYAYSDGEYMICSIPKTKKLALYDIAGDPTQVNDLSEKMPEKKAKLFAQFEERKRELNAENLLMDLMHNIEPAVMIERYGQVAIDVLKATQTGVVPTEPEAAMWFEMLGAFLFSPGAGHQGVGVTLYDDANSPHRARDYTYDPERWTVLFRSSSTVANGFSYYLNHSQSSCKSRGCYSCKRRS